MTDPLLTVTEVAEILRINRHSVTDLIAAGDLAAVNVGGHRTHGARWRISKRDLEKFLANRRSSAAA